MIIGGPMLTDGDDALHRAWRATASTRRSPRRDPCADRRDRPAAPLTTSSMAGRSTRAADRMHRTWSARNLRLVSLKWTQWRSALDTLIRDLAAPLPVRRVKDFAASYLGEIRRVPVMFHQGLAERDQEIAAAQGAARR
jgi:hypothetical protein